MQSEANSLFILSLLKHVIPLLQDYDISKIEWVSNWYR